MDGAGRKKAKQFCIEYEFTVSAKENLVKAVQQLGYTIVEFNCIFNDEDVQTLIDLLGISDDLIRSRGFSYVDSNHRIVFVNEDLSEEEKSIVLAHELGHIYCKHFNHGTIIGVDVQDEFEANEFGQYILNVPASKKAHIWARKHKKVIAFTLAISMIFIVVSAFWIKKQHEEKRYFGDYYVTETGNKYHEKDCIFIKDKTSVHRLTIEEFESGKYEPCKTCLP